MPTPTPRGHRGKPGRFPRATGAPGGFPRADRHTPWQRVLEANVGALWRTGLQPLNVSRRPNRGWQPIHDWTTRIRECVQPVARPCRAFTRISRWTERPWTVRYAARCPPKSRREWFANGSPCGATCTHPRTRGLHSPPCPSRSGFCAFYGGFAEFGWLMGAWGGALRRVLRRSLSGSGDGVLRWNCVLLLVLGQECRVGGLGWLTPRCS